MSPSRRPSGLPLVLLLPFLCLGPGGTVCHLPCLTTWDTLLGKSVFLLYIPCKRRHPLGCSTSSQFISSSLSSGLSSSSPSFANLSARSLLGMPIYPGTHLTLTGLSMFLRRVLNSWIIAWSATPGLP